MDVNTPSYSCSYSFYPTSYVESVRSKPLITHVDGWEKHPQGELRRAAYCPDSKATPIPEKVALLAVWPEGNVGDQSQSAGITDAIKAELLHHKPASIEHLAHESVALKALPAGDQAAALARWCKEWFGNLDAGNFDHLIVIAAGSGSGIAATLGELSGHPRVTTVFSGHQLTSDLANAARLPDITALPSGILNPQQLAALTEKTELVLVAGVATHLTRQSIAETVATYNAKGYEAVPQVDADTVAVILGGDAPDESGQQRLITEENARSLARHIIAWEKPHSKTTFIVTNGPRTGKHAVDKGGNSLNAHRSDFTDPVTVAFVDELEKLTQSKIYLFDFQFGKLPSAYRPIIDRYLEAGEQAGHIYVPAESSSMVSETGLLSKKRVISVTESTNPSHMRVVSEELSKAGGTVLHLDGQVEHVAQTSTRKSSSAAFEIAKAVLARIWPNNRFCRHQVPQVEPSCPNESP
jgi:hypothetical protein